MAKNLHKVQLHLRHKKYSPVTKQMTSEPVRESETCSVVQVIPKHDSFEPFLWRVSKTQCNK